MVVVGEPGSHPAWVCGLKLFSGLKRFVKRVTPCVGVWIETGNKVWLQNPCWVTPCVGVWIETIWNGLFFMFGGVTPCVGVWIETREEVRAPQRLSRHTLRGCVD